MQLVHGIPIHTIPTTSHFNCCENMMRFCGFLSFLSCTHASIATSVQIRTVRTVEVNKVHRQLDLQFFSPLMASQQFMLNLRAIHQLPFIFFSPKQTIPRKRHFPFPFFKKKTPNFFLGQANLSIHLPHTSQSLLRNQY